MDIIKKIELYHANMTKAEYVVADKILVNLHPLANEPIKKAAELYNTSPATLIRLSKRLGFSGYSELSFQIKGYITEHKKEEKKISKSVFLDGLISTFSESLKEIVTFDVEKEIDKLIDSMRNAERIIAVGLGHSGLAAEHLMYLMLTHEILVDSITDKIIINKLPLLLKKGDLVIIFSASADADNYKYIFERASKSDVTFALVTMNVEAEILKNADITLYLPLVHGFNENGTGIQYIDSRPMFYILISCIDRRYNNRFPIIN
ncbi:MurR/RpiR family transcriptional regulator [Ligilactobacillus sp. WILCCON 0076]|uniref:MurR/RpiR family transcriptional regulator n=1 Tax=Ligilactobacillus ubinensis TaxID=2876789 RepID=A0A9X2FLS8_9LACO|nr:MurR/RpiR family transcriptional regulator [Ligilactobacillus ubinensis]MCP0887966.1 MurR/RpiR family transcriptional regulator [Ligilactobacillus ubinensis]